MKTHHEIVAINAGAQRISCVCGWEHVLDDDTFNRLGRDRRNDILLDEYNRHARRAKR